ncbi:MAG: hypothetical protein IJR13_00705 [Bacteroidales bacterium]|nr:hypothetical protein [Bacteroidales bacterium]
MGTAPLENIAGRQCHIFCGNAPRYLLLQPLGRHEQRSIADEAAFIANTATEPVCLVAFEVDDWNRDLTPWQDPAISHDPLIGQAAEASYAYIAQQLLPYLYAHYGVLPTVIGGYSLGGLFALWAAKCGLNIDAVAAASPSLWIRDWPSFSSEHPTAARYIYLSLGQREEHSKNKSIAQIGNRVRNEYRQLCQHLGISHCTLRWNRGGHFDDNARRTAEAFAWCVNQLARQHTRQHNYHIRHATPSDIEAIMAIIEEARAIMRANGNNQQWVNGYPSQQLIENDIAEGIGYVAIDDDGLLSAYFALLPSPEPTYAVIDGQWADDTMPYHALHRIGSRASAHGIFKTVTDFALSIDPNLRIDTHRDNLIMQHLFEKYAFTRCGIIHLANGDERIAYQKMRFF